MSANGKTSTVGNNVPLCKPSVGTDELRAIAQVFKEGALSHGPQVTEFEVKFAKKIGVKHAIALNSCTSGLYLACQYIYETYGEGEIIVPSFTFVASANSIACAGMTPRFVDVNWETGLTSVRDIEPAINERTRGIMVVHYAGRPCQMTEIMELAARHNLPVIEDSAECLGAELDGHQVGSFGWGIFSFYSTKNITTGEGGMVTCNDDTFNSWLRLRVAHGVAKASYSRDGVAQKWYRNAVVSGQNFRLSNFQAAMGIVQLEKLDRFNAARYVVAEEYRLGLAGTSNITIPGYVPPGTHSYQMYPIKVDPAKRDQILFYLNDHGVGASVHFDPPVHWQSAYSEEKIVLPVTERLSLSTITLPISAEQTSDQTQQVIKTLKEALAL